MMRTIILLSIATAMLATTSCKKKEKAKDQPTTDQPAPMERGMPAMAADPMAMEKPKPAMKVEPKPAMKVDPFAKLPKINGSVHGEEVTYKAGNVTLKGYLAWDKAKKGKRPGVLVVHEWWGHNPYARMRARMLAKMGYTALALDMYGEGKNTTHPADAMKFMSAVMKNIPDAENRFKAARALLEKHQTTDPKKTAAIGYCFGGAVVLHMARVGMDLAGVASFHGSLGAKAKAKKGKVKAKILVLHGAADPFVPAEQVEAFKKEMKEVGAKMQFHAYAGAKHAFTNPGADALSGGKLPLAYDKEADTKSWAELTKFLAGLFPAK